MKKTLKCRRPRYDALTHEIFGTRKRKGVGLVNVQASTLRNFAVSEYPLIIEYRTATVHAAYGCNDCSIEGRWVRDDRALVWLGSQGEHAEPLPYCHTDHSLE